MAKLGKTSKYHTHNVENHQVKSAQPPVHPGIPGQPMTDQSGGGYQIDSKSLGSSKFAQIMATMFNSLNNHVQSMNSSKMFAGLMIIILNISSKFVNLKLSKSMESYLKYTFSRQILVFAIAWMGTRDIYIALIISTIFVFCMDYLMNEDSPYCILPETFTTYHVELLTNQSEVTPEQIKDAYETIAKANAQNNANTKPTPTITPNY